MNSNNARDAIMKVDELYTKDYINADIRDSLIEDYLRAPGGEELRAVLTKIVTDFDLHVYYNREGLQARRKIKSFLFVVDHINRVAWISILQRGDYERPKPSVHIHEKGLCVKKHNCINLTVKDIKILRYKEGSCYEKGFLFQSNFYDISGPCVESNFTIHKNCLPAIKKILEITAPKSSE